MLELKNVKKTLSESFTLDIDSLHITPGSRVALIGTNGSGKSTLLKLLAGIIKADCGVISISTQNIGYQPQNPYIWKGSVKKNILLGAHSDCDIVKLAEECLLEKYADKPCSHLSGGERQRVCFARMLAGNYSLLMLDEPLSQADIEIASQLNKVLLQHCQKNNTTLLFSTHLPSHAFDLATHILIMNKGKIAEYSSVDKLKNPSSEFGKSFMSGWKI